MLIRCSCAEKGRLGSGDAKARHGMEIWKGNDPCANYPEMQFIVLAARARGSFFNGKGGRRTGIQG